MDSSVGFDITFNQMYASSDIFQLIYICECRSRTSELLFNGSVQLILCGINHTNTTYICCLCECECECEKRGCCTAFVAYSLLLYYPAYARISNQLKKRISSVSFLLPSFHLLPSDSNIICCSNTLF